MKKVLYYSPYIPVIGMFTGFIGIWLDFDTCSNVNVNNKHFWLSALVNGVSTCLIFLFIIFKNQQT